VKFADFQASSTFKIDGRVMSACEKCRFDHAERTPPGTPQCESCRVELREENEAAAQVYMLTRRQYVTAEQGRIVDISIPAVKTVMDMIGVEDQLDCLNRVRKLFHAMREKEDDGE
jgi:hypothetical protein